MKSIALKQVMIAIMLLLSQNNIFSQAKDYKYYNQSFVVMIKSDSLYDAGEYRKSIEYKLTQLDTTGAIIEPYTYTIAQCYALLGIPDSAFYYLNLYVDGTPKDYRPIYVDSDFELLRKNSDKWDIIISKIEDIYLREFDSSMNKEFAVKLFRLGIEEQRYGVYTMISCRRTEEPPLKQLIKQSTKVTKCFNKLVHKYGFPTPSMVGQTAAISAFYIIQHSIIKDKYYYMVKEAYENGDYWPEYYALITDRWRIQNGKIQIYGTQLSSERNSEGEQGAYILDPVEDFKNVNKRRLELGMPTVEEYVKKMKGIIPKDYYNDINEENTKINGQ